MTETQGEVVVIEPQEQAMVRAAPGDVVVAFEEYRKIQQGLDAALPDCMMTIQGKKFRKKNYWRAIATAFNLTVRLTSEELAEHSDDWGYLVVFTATASNGRSADGDGSCFASEKSANQATVHNVRAHAHTRAYNRAVSNLVGFGEVSAEEMMQEQRQSQGSKRGAAPQSTGGRKITEPQRKRLFAKGSTAAKRLDVPAEQVDEYAKAWMAERGFESSTELTREFYDTLCETLDGLTLTHLAVPPVREEEPPPPGDGDLPL